MRLEWLLSGDGDPRDASITAPASGLAGDMAALGALVRELRMEGIPIPDDREMADDYVALLRLIMRQRGELESLRDELSRAKAGAYDAEAGAEIARRMIRDAEEQAPPRALGKSRKAGA